MARGDYDDMVTDDGNRRLRRGNRRTVLATLFFIIVALIVLVIYLIANPAESVSVNVKTTETEETKDTSSSDTKKSTLFDFSGSSSSADNADKVYVLPDDSVQAEEPPAAAAVETESVEETTVTENAITEDTPEELIQVEEVVTEEPQAVTVESASPEPAHDDHGSLMVTQTIVDITEESPLGEDETAAVNTTETVSEETAAETSAGNEEITVGSVAMEVVEALSDSDSLISKTVENVSSALEDAREQVADADDIVSSTAGRVAEGEDVISAVTDFVESIVDAALPMEEEVPLVEEIITEEIPSEEETVSPAPVTTPDTAEETAPAEEITLTIVDESPAEESVTIVIDDEVPAVTETSDEVMIEEETVSPEATSEEPVDAADSVLLVNAEDVVSDSSSRIEDGSLVISGKSGSAVKSVAAGTVIEAGRENGRKYVIVLDNDGEAVKYSGFERVTVKVKSKVKKGSVLGSIGSSSDSTITLTSVAVE